MTAFLDDVDLLERLVCFDSTSRNSNLPLADFICDYLDGPGVRIERVPSADGSKTNLSIAFGPTLDRSSPEPDGDVAGSRPGLVLSGHMDVVPADEDEWRSDPFTLREEDGRLIGRGACDMKGFLAVAMNAARRTADSLACPLVLLFTYDEELGTLGARRLVDVWREDGRLPRAAIIGEPTSLRAVRMHKGHTKLRLTLYGEAAHSGHPRLGVNAIEAAGRAITALTGLREALEGEPPELAAHFPDVPYVAYNVATIHGGRAVNVVPDRCEIEIGYRVLPGLEGPDIAERTRAVLDAALAEDAYELEVAGESPPMLIPADAAVLAVLCEEIGQIGSHSVSFATDAGWLQSLGLECAIWGPGDIAVAHKPNEWVPIEELRRCAAILDRAIARLCANGRP